jgi:pantoate--beta-alanine ligase
VSAADDHPAGLEAPTAAPRTTAEAGELRRLVRAWKQRGGRVALVPTMGALHEGHLALVRLAAARADRVVASVFVNPTQFGPGEDFESYPRRPREDAALLGENGCDLVFLPEIATLYPAGSVTYVDLAGAEPAAGSTRSPSEGLEGTSRPGHFRGVATVVAKLFNLVEPDVAVFGEKDAQQLAVVRRMVRDLHFAVEIVAHPTVREDDGLAMSSRNAYLSPEERAAAARIYRTLRAAARRIEAGERDPQAVRRLMRERLGAEPLFDLDYAEVVDPETFEPVETIESDVVLPVAVGVGGTRLLDNVTVRVRT